MTKEYKCEQCEKLYTTSSRTKPQHRLCNRECYNNFYYKLSKNKKIEINCINCNKSFLKSIKEIERTKGNFCSHSCAGTYNNLHSPAEARKLPQGKCKVCELPIPSSRVYCDDCFSKKTIIKDTPEITEKTCKVCKCIKPINQYPRKSKPNLDGRYPFYSECKTCFNARMIKIQRNRKQQAIEYLGHSCSRCGYNKCQAALEFHHLDPTQKDFTIAAKANTSFDKLKPELDKCILLCSNCHKEVHYEEKNGAPGTI